MDHKKIFAGNLKRYMKENGKSRREMCAVLNVSYFTFSDWVNAKKMPRMDSVERIAEYFGCRKSDLIENKTEEPAENSELSRKKKELREKNLLLKECIRRIDYKRERPDGGIGGNACGGPGRKTYDTPIQLHFDLRV